MCNISFKSLTGLDEVLGKIVPPEVRPENIFFIFKVENFVNLLTN